MMGVAPDRHVILPRRDHFVACPPWSLHKAGGHLSYPNSTRPPLYRAGQFGWCLGIEHACPPFFGGDRRGKNGKRSDQGASARSE